MPPAPFHPKTLVRSLALAALGLVCSQGAAQGRERPAEGLVQQDTSPAFTLGHPHDQEPPAPDERATMPPDADERATMPPAPGERATMPPAPDERATMPPDAEPRGVDGPEAEGQLLAAPSWEAGPHDGAGQSFDPEKAVLPEPKKHRPGRLLRGVRLLWTALLLFADPQAGGCQPFPLPVGPPPGPLPPAFPPTLTAPAAFQWLPPQELQPLMAKDQAGATAALKDALAQSLRLPLPVAEVTQVLANLTGATVATTFPPSRSSEPPDPAPMTTPDPATPTDLEAATTALADAARFVQDEVIAPGTLAAPGTRSRVQTLAQITSMKDRIDHALAQRANGLASTDDATSNAVWNALASFATLASGALASPTALNNAALIAGTASEIDETITNFINLHLVTDFRLPAIELNLERFAQFSTLEGTSPEHSGIGPPSIQAERPECLNCTRSCNFLQNSYQYATALYGEEAATINLLAYAYFFTKGVELATLDSAILANSTEQLTAKAARAAPSRKRSAFPAPLQHYTSLQSQDLPPLLPLDTVSVQDVMSQLGMTGPTPYDPGCTPCCFLEVNKPLLAAARISVLTAWLNAIGAGLFGLRVDLAVQAYLETLDPAQQPAALAGIQANATQYGHDFFDGATPPPPGSSQPEAASDLMALQAALAQTTLAVGSDGAPPSPQRLPAILGAAMQNRQNSRLGTNTNLTDTGWYGLQVLTNLATRMPATVSAKVVAGSVNLAQQWVANTGYLLRLLSNAVGIEANLLATTRTARILLDSANNRTQSSVDQEPGHESCASRKCVKQCNHLNFQIQYGAAKTRFVAAQIGGVAYILAVTANLMNLGVDANQIILALIAQPTALPPANRTASRRQGVAFESTFQAPPSAAPAPSAEAFAGLIAPMDASLASAMNLTQVIALPGAFLSANTYNGLPMEIEGLPGVIEWVQQYVRAGNESNNCLPCCDIENSVEILAIDAATLLSSQFVMSGYVLTDVAAGLRIGLQATLDLSLLPTLVQATRTSLSAPTPPGQRPRP